MVCAVKDVDMVVSCCCCFQVFCPEQWGGPARVLCQRTVAAPEAPWHAPAGRGRHLPERRGLAHLHGQRHQRGAVQAQGWVRQHAKCVVSACCLCSYGPEQRRSPLLSCCIFTSRPVITIHQVHLILIRMLSITYCWWCRSAQGSMLSKVPLVWRLQGFAHSFVFRLCFFLATDAKERQHWVSRLQICTQHHTEAMGKVRYVLVDEEWRLTEAKLWCLFAKIGTPRRCSWM